MDMPEDERNAFLQWLDAATDEQGRPAFLAWVVGEEHAGPEAELNLHLQCVVRCRITKGQALTLRVKGALGWNQPPVRAGAEGEGGCGWQQPDETPNGCAAPMLLQFTGRSAGAGHVKSRELTYRRGDTFERMAGYCQKDEGQEGYRLHTEGVPEEVLRHGREIYQACGPNPQGERTLIKRAT